MNEQPKSGIADKATALAQQRTDLAVKRTIIAADRTLMAWIRTSVSMIGFGFTIYKFLQYLRQSQEAMGTPILRGPRNLALTLIAFGTVALIASTIQHVRFLRALGVESAKARWSMTVIIALLMSLLGTLVFFSIMLRVGPY